ncbi:50S ribosomal protein L23 [Bacillus toyonensis]
MRDPRDIIKRPVITERSMEMMAEKNTRSMWTLNLIKQKLKMLLKRCFGVKVEKVNIMNYKPKAKRVGRHAGFTSRRRKAIVKLTADSKEIEIFQGV